MTVVVPRLTLRVHPGDLIVVRGPVGCGKSTLLAGLLGEAVAVHGHVGMAAAVRATGFGYAAQEPWVQNGSVRDNIVFGRPFDAARYHRVLFACALLPDLDLFDGNMARLAQRGRGPC